MEDSYGLRERKAAKTKINFCRAFISRLSKHRFQEISIREICEEEELSEATFYNYFPRKEDVLFYFFYLSELELGWHLREWEGKKNAVELIEEMIYWKASRMEDPNLFFEILSVFASEKKCPEHVELSPAEKYFAFPNLKGIEEIPIKRMEVRFTEFVGQAIKEGMIQSKNSASDISRYLFSLFIGTMLSLEAKEFSQLKKVYKKQLAIFWSTFEVSQK